MRNRRPASELFLLSDLVFLLFQWH